MNVNETVKVSLVEILNTCVLNFVFATYSGTHRVVVPKHLLIYSSHLKLKEAIGQGK